MLIHPIKPYGPSREPRNLVSLMQLYDQNYAMLLKLIPALAADPDQLTVDREYRSVIEGDPAVHLVLEERTRYTVVVRLTHYFERTGLKPGEGAGPVADPDLRVRLFFDARQAEVLHCGRNYHCDILRQYRGPAHTVLERRWQVNALLHKWLKHLLERGHRFPVRV